MENQEIKDNIERALAILYRTEKELISDKGHEQSIAARLMLHLQHLLPEWDVDVEFNRQGKSRDPKRDTAGRRRKPDIIIHKRGPEGPNLAVILVKGWWNTEAREKDEAVVQSLKKKHRYQAAFVVEVKVNEFEVVEK